MPGLSPRLLLHWLCQLLNPAKPLSLSGRRLPWRKGGDQRKILIERVEGEGTSVLLLFVFDFFFFFLCSCAPVGLAKIKSFYLLFYLLSGSLKKVYMELKGHFSFLVFFIVYFFLLI